MTNDNKDSKKAPKFGSFKFWQDGHKEQVKFEKDGDKE